MFRFENGMPCDEAETWNHPAGRDVALSYTVASLPGCSSGMQRQLLESQMSVAKWKAASNAVPFAYSPGNSPSHRQAAVVLDEARGDRGPAVWLASTGKGVRPVAELRVEPVRHRQPNRHGEPARDRDSFGLSA